ncbi:hypothetical protein O6H91_11G019200 [Diphasiastrum complanatum]|uniref:Uncharacterized protein n=1 Tax=Diphasiastrum complanatum TaxID=34168 RepID=A0ACC2C6R7_DIPCM|nr:hypothetical protein O6H91_11G019200 [Diphasiastrum complanatum]
MEDYVNFFDLLPDDVINLILTAVSDCKSLVRCMAVSKYLKQHSARVSSLSIECPGQFPSYEDKLEKIYSMVKEFHSLESLIVRVGQPKDEPPSWASCMRYAEIGTSVEKFMFMAAKSGEFSELDIAVRGFRHHASNDQSYKETGALSEIASSSGSQASQRKWDSSIGGKSKIITPGSSNIPGEEEEALLNNVSEETASKQEARSTEILSFPHCNIRRIGAGQGSSVSQKLILGAGHDFYESANEASTSRQTSSILSSASRQSRCSRKVPEFTLRQVVAPSNNVLRRMVPVIVFAIVQGLDEFRDKVPSFIEKFTLLKRFLLVDLLESVTVYMREHQIQDIRFQLRRESEAEPGGRGREEIAESENLDVGQYQGEKEDSTVGDKMLEKQSSLHKPSSSIEQKLVLGSKGNNDTWNLLTDENKERYCIQNVISVEVQKDYKGKRPDVADKHNQTVSRYNVSEKGKGRVEDPANMEDNMLASEKAVCRAEIEFSGCGGPNFWHMGESSLSYSSESVPQAEQGNLGYALTHPMNNENNVTGSSSLYSGRDAIGADYVQKCSGVIQEESSNFDKTGKVLVESEEASIKKVMPSAFKHCAGLLELYPKDSIFQNQESKAVHNEFVLEGRLDNCPIDVPLVPVTVPTKDSSQNQESKAVRNEFVLEECLENCPIDGVPLVPANFSVSWHDYNDSQCGGKSNSINFQEGGRDSRSDSLLKHCFKRSLKSDTLRLRETDRFIRIGDKKKDRLEDVAIKRQENLLYKDFSFRKKEDKKGVKTCRPGMEDDDKLLRELERRDKMGMEDKKIRSIHGSWCKSQAYVPECPSGKELLKLSSVEDLNLSRLGIKTTGPTTADQEQVYSMTQGNEAQTGSCQDDCFAGNKLASTSGERQDEDICRLDGSGSRKEQPISRDVNKGIYHPCIQLEERGKRIMQTEAWRETWRESLRKRVRDHQREMQRQSELERESEARRERIRAEMRRRQLDIEQEALSFNITFWRAEKVSAYNYCLSDVSMCIATNAAKPLLLADLDLLSQAALAGSLLAATVSTVNNQASVPKL